MRVLAPDPAYQTSKRTHLEGVARTVPADRHHGQDPRGLIIWRGWRARSRRIIIMDKIPVGLIISYSVLGSCTALVHSARRPMGSYAGQLQYFSC
jgi:hypothetical protein